MFFLRGKHLAGIRAPLKSIGAIRISTCKIFAAKGWETRRRGTTRRRLLRRNYDLYFPLCAANGPECEIMQLAGRTPSPLNALCVDVYLPNQSKPASRVHRAPMVKPVGGVSCANIARKSTAHFTVLHAPRPCEHALLENGVLARFARVHLRCIGAV